MKKAIVVDFDGTFVKVNSFELFAKYLVFFSISHINFRLFAFLFLELLKRKFRLESHEELKKHILFYLKNNCIDNVLSTFLICLKSYVNDDVLNRLRKWKQEEYIIVLSSAAPEYYLKYFIQQYPDLFDYTLSTPTPKSNQDLSWNENIREIKCKRTVTFLQINNLEFTFFLTDHYDDIPLLKVHKSKNILISPSNYTIEKLTKNNVKFEIL